MAATAAFDMQRFQKRFWASKKHCLAEATKQKAHPEYLGASYGNCRWLPVSWSLFKICNHVEDLHPSLKGDDVWCMPAQKALSRKHRTTSCQQPQVGIERSKGILLPAECVSMLQKTFHLHCHCLSSPRSKLTSNLGHNHQ